MKVREILKELAYSPLTTTSSEFVEHSIDRALSELKALLPKKLLHTHNSIPSYVDDLEDGCVECVRNQAIADMEEKFNE